MRGRVQKRIAALLLCALTVCGMAPCALASSKDDFFNDAVFFGDSITVGLVKYATNQRKSDDNFLGTARFLCEGGYMVSHINDDDSYEKHPEYNGTRQRPAKSLRDMEPGKVFILMGINDAAGEVSLLLDNYAAMLDILQSAIPAAKLHILAVFPMTTAKENTARNNKKIDQINEGLLKLAMRRGVTFIDITDALKSGNALRGDYSSDNYVHISEEGYAVWTSLMYKYAAFALRESGTGSAKIVNVQEYVNGRSKASKKGKIVAKIPRGASVEILEQSGEWYKVAYDGAEMYVYDKYLSTGNMEGVVSNVSEYANLRALPDADAEAKGRADKGDTLSVSSLYYSPDWYRVMVDGEPAYINKSYLELPE